MKILVMAAFDPELAFLRTAIAADRALADRVDVAAVGIGLVDAALGARDALREHAPDRVVLIGTCGAYLGADAAIGDVVSPVSTTLVDLAIETAVGAGLPGSFDAVALDEQMSKNLRIAAENAAIVKLATTLSITTDDALSRSRGARFALEHLELSAVANACTKAGVPLAALLGVANRCGSSARDEWRTHHTAVEAKTGAALLRFLREDERMKNCTKD